MRATQFKRWAERCKSTRPTNDAFILITMGSNTVGDTPRGKAFVVQHYLSGLTAAQCVDVLVRACVQIGRSTVGADEAEVRRVLDEAIDGAFLTHQEFPIA